MNIRFATRLLSFAWVLLAFPAMAQDDYDFHPALTDKFTLSLGLFFSNDSYKFSANGSDGEVGDDIDFGKSVGVGQSSNLFDGLVRWDIG